MDAGDTARREGAQRTVQKISRCIRVGISMDRKIWVEDSGHTIEYLLTSDSPLIREAWVDMWGWYIYVANRPPPTACVNLETPTEECAEIYTHVPPPGKIITIEVPAFPVDYNILGEEDISEAVLRL